MFKNKFLEAADLVNASCSKFVSDIILFVTSSMAMRDRSSESARFEILSAEYRYGLLNAIITPNLSLILSFSFPCFFNSLSFKPWTWNIKRSTVLVLIHFPIRLWI